MLPDSFLIVLVHSLLSFGINPKQIKQAIIVVLTAVSARLGSPIITMLKGDRPEMIPNLVSRCLKAIPEGWYRYVSKKLDSSLESLNWKTIVDPRGLLPSSSLNMINGYYLDPNREYHIGYLGAMLNNTISKLANLSSTLVVDMNEDTSSILSYLGKPEEVFHKLEAEVQAIWLQANLNLIPYCTDKGDGSNMDFLDKVGFDLKGTTEKISPNSLERIYALPGVFEVARNFDGKFISSIADLPVKKNDGFQSSAFRGVILKIASNAIKHSKAPISDLPAHLLELQTLMFDLTKDSEKGLTITELFDKAETGNHSIPPYSTTCRNINKLVALGKITREKDDREWRYKVKEHNDPFPGLVYLDSEENGQGKSVIEGELPLNSNSNNGDSMLEEPTKGIPTQPQDGLSDGCLQNTDNSQTPESQPNVGKSKRSRPHNKDNPTSDTVSESSITPSITGDPNLGATDNLTSSTGALLGGFPPFPANQDQPIAS